MELKSFVTKGLSTLHVLHISTRQPLFSDSDPITGERPKIDDDEVDQGVPVTITGFGHDSNEYRAIESEQTRRLQKRIAAQYKKNKGKNFLPEDRTPEEKREAATFILAGMIREWTGLAENGTPFEPTERNKEWLMENAEDIREQWDRHVHDRADFLPSA